MTSRAKIYADQNDAERSAASHMATKSKTFALIAGEQNRNSRECIWPALHCKKSAKLYSHFVVSGEQNRHASG